MPASAEVIAAIATPAGRGGIGVVRVSGPDLTRIVVGIIGRPLPPRVATVAAFMGAHGETLVHGALELRVKESDRLAAMATGLARLGVDIELLADGMWIRGDPGGFGGGAVDSHGDHRIAMAFAAAATRARGPIEVRDVASVATSFPNFVASARAVGLQIELCPPPS